MTSLPPITWRDDREATEIIIGAMQMPGMYQDGAPMDSYPGEGREHPLWAENVLWADAAQAQMDEAAALHEQDQADFLAPDVEVAVADDAEVLVDQDVDHP